MKKKSIVTVLVQTSLMLAAVLFYNSCARAPIVPVPPAFNLYNYNRLVIIPFDNNTHDPALAKALQDKVMENILELNAVPVIDSARVAAYLQTIKAKASDVATDDNLRKKIAEKFKCNLILTGAAENFTETFKDTAPERLKNPDTNQMEWGFFSKRKVVVDFTANLMDAESGSLLWKRKGNGYSWFNKWNQVPVPGNVAVPEELGKFANFANMVNNRVNNKPDSTQLELDRNPDGALVYTKNSDFVGLRNDAIDGAVDSVTVDFKGSQGWTPGGAVTK